MTTTRRDFVNGLLGLALGGNAIIPNDGATGNEDIDKLVKWYGVDAVLKRVGELIKSNEPITWDSINKPLRKAKRMAIKYEKQRRRREQISDSVIYRGPVCLSHEMLYYLVGLRPVKSAVNNKSLLVGETYRVMTLGKHTVPIGSRLLVDNRRDLRDISQCELVETNKDKRKFRLHIWSRTTPWEGECRTHLLFEEGNYEIYEQYKEYE